MSVRAYRIVKKELAEDCSFNLWHDQALIDIFSCGQGFHDFRNEDGNGTLEISVSVLEKALENFEWQKEDYRLEAIKADIAWAKENQLDYVTYDCF